MDSIYPTTDGASSKQHLWPRDQISQLVARTTAQNWQRNRARLEQESGLDPTVVEFFRITPRARVPT